ncbi:MAG: twin-arginine translocase subunit TatC [Acidimicrobiales bacterium]
MSDGDSPPNADDSSRMPLVAHLGELRRRLIISAVALAVGAAVAFNRYHLILEVLIGPYQQITGRSTLLITDPLEGFATRLRVAGWCGAFLVSPVILWQVWRFITPGLHRKEKRYAIPFIVASILLFSAGAATALFTFEQALRFLVGVGGENLDTFFSPSKYLGLIILMVIGFGVAFEFPVVLVCLQLAGVLTTVQLRRWRRGAAVGVVAAAAVLTPSQDPWTLFALAAPLYLFYEASILIGRALKK